MVSLLTYRKMIAHAYRHDVILKQARKNKEVIYGAQALKAQMPGFIARPTEDYDIYSRHPKKSARELEKSMDKLAGFDNYYTKQATYKHTTKVMDIGMDMKRGTEDDFNIADYTKMKKVNTKNIRGVKYAKREEVIKDKLRSLRNKEFEYRHPKDYSDIKRESIARELERLRNPRLKRILI